MSPRVVHDGLWITSVPVVDISTPTVRPARSDTFSPRVVHMSDTLATLQERCAPCTFPQDLLQPFLEYFFKQKHQGVDTVKFRCDRDALSEALQTVQRGVSSRPGIPALTGVLIEATDDGRLTLTTTDLEVSARLATQVQVSEPGIALVPARLLGDTVKSLSAAPVDFETDQSQAHIRCAAYEGTLRLLPAEDFPGLQEPNGTQITAGGGSLRRSREPGRARRLARRGAAGAHRRPDRGQPRGRGHGRHRLLPVGGSRAGRHRRRRGQGHRARSARSPRRAARPPPTRRRRSRSSWTSRRSRSGSVSSRSRLD